MTSQTSGSPAISTRTSTTTAPTALTLLDELAAEDVPNIIDPNRWFFDKEKLESTPSRRCGVDPDKELAYRQQSANFIQDMGQRLQVNQLCINTAIVYMHRFFMFHSFTQFNRNHVSTASIFLAAKVEEQPRKLEHVIKVAHFCLNRESPPIDVKTDVKAYLEQTSELVITENILLQTLGFDVAIDHPHTHVVKCCQLVRASKDLAQTSYFMATNSLHLTTMCLQYKPTVVACVCIHLTCKWSSWEIPRSKEGRDWFWYVDDSVTMDQLEKLTTEFLAIFEKSPSRLKKKILSLNQVGGVGGIALSSFPTLSMDPHSPGPQFSSSSLGKRSSSSSSVKPSQAQINKSAKMNLVNGGVGHHPSKSSQSHGPSTLPPSNSVSKHPSHYSGSKGIPPTGSHHSAKEAHLQHGKPTGHHHSSSGGQQFPPPHGTSSNRPSSHSHHSQSHASLSGQPPKPPSSSSFHLSTSHGMVGQHPKSQPQQHAQPSKAPYKNYNVKSQQQQQQQLPPKPNLNLPPPSPLLLPMPPSINKLPSQMPPPPFNQIKKPYPDVSRRENTSTGDFNGKRENSDELNRRNSSQPLSSRARVTDKSGGSISTVLPSVTLPFNSMPTDPASSRLCTRTSSLFSPEMVDNSISSSIMNMNVKNELSPIGDIIGSSGGVGTKVDFLSENPFAATAPTSLFPNLLNFDFDLHSETRPGNPGNVMGRGPGGSDLTTMKTEVCGNGHGSLGLDVVHDTLTSMLTSQPLSLPATTIPGNQMISSSSSHHTSSSSSIGLSPAKRPLPSEDLITGEEPPHKKSKKSKKEKHRHKDKEKHEVKEKKDKDSSKKHKDKSKDKSSSSKEEKKHKREKRDKDKDKSKDKLKIQNQSETLSVTSPGFTDVRNRFKFTISGNTPPDFSATMVSQGEPLSQHEKSKSKHSSKKHTSKSKTSSSSAIPTPPLKLKIAPIRPPSQQDDKMMYVSKPN